MKILLHSPASTVRRNGNRQTSSEWVHILRDAGHVVTPISAYEGEEADLLIALHANKSREALLKFRDTVPDGRTILALTGTDIYPEPDSDAIDSMRQADCLITLQKKAIDIIPSDCHEKVIPVIQAARVLAPRPTGESKHFDVCVVGHLRDVKDPLLTARASQLLPEDSKIQVLHAGGILDPKYAPLVAEEEKKNPRYTWLGELSEEETARLMASSSLLSLTSWSEGGGRVVGEAIVHGTPVVSTRIEGIVGLLGDAYPGFFPAGDETALAMLLQRCEGDQEFYARINSAAKGLAAQFSPDKERLALFAAVDHALQNSRPETPA